MSYSETVMYEKTIHVLNSNYHHTMCFVQQLKTRFQRLSMVLQFAEENNINIGQTILRFAFVDQRSYVPMNFIEHSMR